MELISDVHWAILIAIAQGEPLALSCLAWVGSGKRQGVNACGQHSCTRNVPLVAVLPWKMSLFEAQVHYSTEWPFSSQGILCSGLPKKESPFLIRSGEYGSLLLSLCHCIFKSVRHWGNRVTSFSQSFYCVLWVWELVSWWIKKINIPDLNFGHVSEEKWHLPTLAICPDFVLLHKGGGCLPLMNQVGGI